MTIFFSNQFSDAVNKSRQLALMDLMTIGRDVEGTTGALRQDS
jgi:hypothetical protein